MKKMCCVALGCNISCHVNTQQPCCHTYFRELYLKLQFCEHCYVFVCFCCSVGVDVVLLGLSQVGITAALSLTLAFKVDQ